MLDDGVADTLRHGLAAGDRDAMRLGLVGDNVDEVVVAEDAREFEQRRGYLERIVGKLHDHVAGRPLERRQQLCDIGAGFGLDEARQLAEHFVVLSHLLVVDAIGHVGVELGHVAEQHIALDVGRTPVQHAKGRERALSLVEFFNHSDTPTGFCRLRESFMPGWRASEGDRCNLM